MAQRVVLVVLVALLGAACRPSSGMVAGAAAASTAEATGPEGCPITVPPQPGFVPPEPYPPEPPTLYQAVWYGTSDLWTMLHPQGEVWRGLPSHERGLGQKTFWWAEGYVWTEEPEPGITVTGRRLDGQGSFQAGGPGTNGFREDIGSFMLVGVGIPSSGCWELTARYREAELSHVIWVEASFPGS